MRLTIAVICSFMALTGIKHTHDLLENLQQEVNYLSQDISRYEAMRSECVPAEDSEP